MTERRAYVLMTAMPPTRGHLALIEFASRIGTTVEVILCTQPGEPYTEERYSSLIAATKKYGNVNIHRIHKELPQEPEDNPGFWDMWIGFLKQFGLQETDYIVASEKYGLVLAKLTGSTFMPYDIGREVLNIKATRIREEPWDNFNEIIPEFQKYLHRTVTIFGTESAGKTTLTRDLTDTYGHLALPEWARPYLETVGSMITPEKMINIWHGQKALQLLGQNVDNNRVTVQDTDLFSTVGYWSLWDYESMPKGLVEDALALKSDLYIIPWSENVPFEKDELRYGGHQRETDDLYWVSLCERYGLKYVLVNGNQTWVRDQAAAHIYTDFHKNAAKLNYIREGNS